MKKRLEERKHAFQEKMRLFRIKHPKCDLWLDKIWEAVGRIYLGYLIFIVIILLIIVVGSFVLLPNDVKELVAPTITVVFSVIIAPLVINMYNQGIQNRLKRFEQNYELYKELMDVLVLLSIENEYAHKRELERVIQRNYSQMILNFNACLFEDLMSLHISCDSKNHENVKYYVQKCINRIRLENENFSNIKISLEMEKIIKNRK